MPASTMYFSICEERQEALVLVGIDKAHDMFDASAVVPLRSKMTISPPAGNRSM